MKKNRLPNRRLGYIQKVKINGKPLYLRTGEYTDGSLGDIFIDLDKEGSTLGSLIDCFAIAISVGLQYGVPLEEYADKFIFAKFPPSGVVTGHERIKMCDSIIDFVFRDLMFNYKHDESVVHVKETYHEESIE